MIMADGRIYMDYSATTPVDPEVLEAMMPYLSSSHGNPSSLHAFGRTARIAVENAREQVASLVGARPSEIVFTAGGTEADNMAVVGSALAGRAKGRHLITSRAEHHAVLHSAEALEHQGFDVSYVPCDSEGVVNPAKVASCAGVNTILISLMHVNNEIGAINPIAEIGAFARSRGVIFHTDAVQSAGKLPLNVDTMKVDLLSMSAHKLYGPKGIGALYVRQGVTLSPLMHGGAQERGKRAGTENVAGIVGFGKAAELAIHRMKEDGERLTHMREWLWNRLQREIPSIVLHGPPNDRLPGHLNISLPGISGDDLATCLDLEGIAVSTGSACSSGAVHVSHVLQAIGADRASALGAVRISMGRPTTQADVEKLVASILAVMRRLSTPASG